MDVGQVSRTTYYVIAVALGVLLVATLLASALVGGALGLLIAMLIATAKALLVALYFMHIRFTRGIVRVFAAAGLLWLAILIGLTLADVLTRGDRPIIAPQQRADPPAAGVRDVTGVSDVAAATGGGGCRSGVLLLTSRVPCP